MRGIFSTTPGAAPDRRSRRDLEGRVPRRDLRRRRRHHLRASWPDLMQECHERRVSENPVTATARPRIRAAGPGSKVMRKYREEDEGFAENALHGKL